ncbi:PPE domain-containing protein [Saccharopolyspora sp. 6M]|uniref:PPE domain-containing protein n=1 Tax=Saccharopolyspora sp. 6M TaxID=2877237 RepID=UPI001CD1DE1E|nr:PPE domain-containing protein [Saccharopolyspora sp. 6M]MCA1229723.1 PPE domain-containing protein [Saccharopolyspora sp. 6M]
MTAPIVIGVALVTPIDSGNVDEIMKKVGFNHPEKYTQITEGAGPDEMSRAADDLKGSISEHFGNAMELLETANRDANVAWEGKAAEQFGNSTKPMTSFLTNAQSTSQAAGESIDRQVDGFLTVRNSMPEPKPVDATDNLLEKGGAFLVGGETDLQQQEREATEAAEAAKQTYETYDSTIRPEVQNPPRFDPPPTQNGDGGQGSFDRSGAINSPMGVGAGGSPGAGGGTAGIGGGSGAGFGPGGSGPSGSGSSWSPGGGGGAGGSLPGGIGVPGGPGVGSGPGGGGAGGIGGGFLPGGPGGSGGAGAGGRSGLGAGGAGGRAGSGGAGAGSGGRAGVGAGANQPGAGGRAGIGTPGAGGAAGGAGAGAAGAGGRGGAGAMGAGGAGRGAKGAGDEDQEHESWLEEQDDVWLNDMPRTAPPVFGE